MSEDVRLVVSPAPPLSIEVAEEDKSEAPIVLELPAPPALVEVEVPGPPGPPGPPGTDAAHVHVQDAPADVWEVAHPLGKYPSVTTVDSSGGVMVGDVVYVDAGSLRVVFSVPLSGRAYLN